MISGRVCLVTGGTSGIGKGIVERFVRADAKVALCGRSLLRVEAAVAELKGQGAREDQVFGAAVDVADNSAIIRFVRQTRDALGPVEVLVSNAGISPKVDGLRQPIEETPDSVWDEVMTVNFKASIRLANAVIADMKEGGFGRIILIGSMATRTVPIIAGAPYVASKAAMSGLVRSFVSEFSQFGITTNIIAPGNVASEMMDIHGPEAMKEIVGRIPIGRLGRPEDIAALVEFLASYDSGFINGATLDINGGEIASP